MTSEQLSELICHCAEPLTTFNSNLELMSEKGQNDLLMSEMAKGDAIMTKTMSCITLEINHEIQSLLSSDLENKIDEKCMLNHRMIKDIVHKLSTIKIPVT